MPEHQSLQPELDETNPAGDRRTFPLPSAVATCGMNSRPGSRALTGSGHCVSCRNGHGRALTSRLKALGASAGGRGDHHGRTAGLDLRDHHPERGDAVVSGDTEDAYLYAGSRPDRGEVSSRGGNPATPPRNLRRHTSNGASRARGTGRADLGDLARVALGSMVGCIGSRVGQRAGASGRVRRAAQVGRFGDIATYFVLPRARTLGADWSVCGLALDHRPAPEPWPSLQRCSARPMAARNHQRHGRHLAGRMGRAAGRGPEPQDAPHLTRWTEIRRARSRARNDGASGGD